MVFHSFSGNRDHHSQPRRQNRHPLRRRSREQDRIREPTHLGPLDGTPYITVVSAMEEKRHKRERKFTLMDKH